MKAFICEIRRFKDHTEYAAHVVLYGANRGDIVHNGLKSLFPDHTWVTVEPAPWLDKPAEATHATPQAVGELVAAPQSLPIYVPAGYKLVPIEPSMTAVKKSQTRLRDRDIEIEDRQVRLIWDLMVQHS